MLDKFLDDIDVKQVKKMSQNAAEKAREVAEDFGGRVRDDYFPRAQAATAAVGKALSAEGAALKDRAVKASDEALTALKTPVKPKRRCPLPLPWLWVTLAAMGAVVGFVAWRRTRPIDDPWAEESWEDIDDDDLVVVSEDTADDEND